MSSYRNPQVQRYGLRKWEVIADTEYLDIPFEAGHVCRNVGIFETREQAEAFAAELEAAQ